MAVNPTDLADANLVESVRRHALWQQPSEWVEEEGVFLMAGANGAPIAYRNCAIRVDGTKAAKASLALSIAYFRERSRGFTLFVRDSRDGDLVKAALSAGLKQRSESPCMVIEAPPRKAAAPHGVTFRGFESLREIEDAVSVNAAAYQDLGVDADQLRAYFSRPDALLAEDVVGVVAYVDGEPVATALTLLSGDSAGLYWVGTRSEARGRGLGAYCTELATRAGFDAGARVVTLQASPYGEPVYRRLGYRTYDRLRWLA